MFMYSMVIRHCTTPRGMDSAAVFSCLLRVELMFTLSTRLCYTHLTLISSHFAVVASRWLQCANGLLLINDLCRLWCLVNCQIFGEYKPHFPHNICYKSGGVAYSLVRLYIVRQYKTVQSMLWCCQSRKSLFFCSFLLLPQGQSSRWLQCCHVVFSAHAQNVAAVGGLVWLDHHRHTYKEKVTCYMCYSRGISYLLTYLLSYIHVRESLGNFVA